MAGPTQRTLELLELLQSAGSRTAPELASRLGVDERTVRRDVERLRATGIPIEAARGRQGGYRIASGHRMPPLALDESEAVAVLVALSVARAGRAGTTAPLATALAKVRRALPRGLAERADALLEIATVGGADPVAEVDGGILLTVAAAIRERHPLALRYRSSDGAVRPRSVQPHDLVARGGRWYLVGLDSASGSRRTFRLDRIRSVRAIAGTFPAPTAHDALGDLVRGFAEADYRYRVLLRVRAPRAAIERVLPPSVASIGAPAEDGWCQVRIRAQRLDWLPRLLLELDAPVVVDEPEELRAALTAAARRLSAIATATG